MRRASIPLPIPCEGITLPFELHTHFGNGLFVRYLRILSSVVSSLRIYLCCSVLGATPVFLCFAMLSYSGMVPILIWGGSSLAVLSTLLVFDRELGNPQVIRDLKKPHQQEILSDYILSKVIFTVDDAVWGVSQSSLLSLCGLLGWICNFQGISMKLFDWTRQVLIATTLCWSTCLLRHFSILTPAQNVKEVFVSPCSHSLARLLPVDVFSPSTSRWLSLCSLSHIAYNFASMVSLRLA